MTRVAKVLIAVASATVAFDSRAQTSPQIADLRRCSLVNGATIDNCRIGYRTFGQRDARASNVILIPTWLGGDSADWPGLLGPGRLVDTTRYHVIVVDALGDGISSSPSMTNANFPQFTIEDMVETQYRLAKEVLGLKRLRAVIGVSMGGIQAFAWGAAHPDFVDRFVSIAGSPQMARHDRAWLQTMVRIIESGTNHHVPSDTTWRMLAGVWLLLNVQDVVNERPAREADSLLTLDALKMSNESKLGDFAAQSRALLAYDFARQAGADSMSAARRLSGRFLVVHSLDDRVVSAAPALAFARQFGLDSLLIRSGCGHGAFTCESRAVGSAIQTFLAR